MSITKLTAPALAGLPHGFLGRTGGVSGGLYASLNVGLGSGDEPARVQENRLRAVSAVQVGARLATVHQVHSPTCVLLDAPWPNDARPHADAMVTTTRGLLLGVLTADCAPVLLADVAAGVIAAAHAGWGGAIKGVIQNTVAMMIDQGARAEQIIAAVGPCIAQRNYEVRDELRQRFLAQSDINAHYFAAGRTSDKWQFDLEGYVALQLAQAGVKQVTLLGEDTYAQEESYFSYRRTTHRKEADYGRQISLIGLP